MRLPAADLPCTDGSRVNPGLIRGRALFFVYPYSGRPGFADPPGWDGIFGAHGSTPQALAYSMACPEFRRLGVRLFGISGQDTEWQQEFADRCRLAFPLLSDSLGAFGRAVPLATFLAGEQPFYVRRTFLVENGEVLVDRQHVFPAQEDAGVMLGEARRLWA